MRMPFERVWSKINILDDKDACWEWTAMKDKRGYGRLWFQRRRMFKANRAVWIVTYGEIPEGLVIRRHLLLGSQADNVKDMIDRGTFPYMGKGENHPRARLNIADVQQIKQRLLKGEKITKLANEFGVGVGTIGSIKSNQTWRNI